MHQVVEHANDRVVTAAEYTIAASVTLVMIISVLRLMGIVG